MHRVRQIIPFMDMLSMKGVLPSPQILKAKDVPNAGVAPRFASVIGYSTFGLFMEKVFHESLEDIPNCNNLIDYIPPDIRHKFKVEDYDKYIKLFCTYFKGNVVKEQVEWNYYHSSESSGVLKVLDGRVADISGHPDVVCGDCVYDIKTSGQFTAMRKSTRHQLLMYFCLAQLTGNTHITKVGIIAPLQNKIVTYDLSEWKWNKYWLLVLQARDLDIEQSKMWPTEHNLEYISFFQLQSVMVGSHVGKTNIELACKERPGIPFQFFVSGNINSNIKYNKAFENKITRLSKVNPLFIHAPYVLNLSKMSNDKSEKEGDDMWVCEKYSKFIEFGNLTGVKGVVIHTGRQVKLDKETAMLNMRKSIIKSCDSVKGCVILLETPAGQKGELLDDIDEFIDFWKSLPDEVKPKIQVCVDTCHIFSNGYNPFEYIKKVHNSGVPIGLVHYNESKMKLGSRKDRHGSIGSGWIGFDIMNKVLLFCLDNHIPCVYE
uniref:AP (Apurinic) endonuclease family 2 n=1 Tax=Pithovirus LCPAC101 TaxID=2506586 RepID=A0A481Z335_9VIRU|nr:MAG: AP (apurinic) endonuclease family 2 [Pithovirus LCPAC101]